MPNNDPEIEPGAPDEGDISFTEFTDDVAEAAEAHLGEPIREAAQPMMPESVIPESGIPDTDLAAAAGDTGDRVGATGAATAAAGTAATAVAKPIADSIELKSDKPKSNKRQYVLLGLLGLLIAALAYDYKVARPKVEEASLAIDAKNAVINRDPEAKFTPDVVREVIGFEPSETFMDGDSKVEAYGYQSGLPLRKHYLYITYKPFKGEDIFYKLEKYSYEENEIRGNLIATDDGSDAMLADESGRPIGMTPQPQPDAVPAESEAGYEDLAAAPEESGDPVMEGEDSESELEMPVAAMRPAGGGDAMEDEDMPADAIRPGTYEWDKWETTIIARDTDDDGVLSKEEMSDEMLEYLEVIDINHNELVEVEELIIYVRGKKRKEIKQLMSARDADGDGLLAGGELGENMKNELDIADMDGNQALDIEEILMYLRNKEAEENESPN